MAKKRYKDGGDVDYAKDVTNFVKRHQTNKKVTDLSVKDIPAVAKEFGTTAAGFAALPFADIASSAVNAYRRRNAAKDQKATEPLGAQKTETDRAREEAKEIKMQKANEKAYNQSLRSEGMRNGGVTRADGCITKGHTRGKMV